MANRRKPDDPSPPGATYDAEDYLTSFDLSAEERAHVVEQDRQATAARKAIDRSQGIRDGFIRPPWAAVDSKSVGQVTANSRPTKRAEAVLRDLYPPKGRPPSGLLLKMVTNAVADECKRRDWKPPSQDVVARASGRRPAKS